MEQISNPAGLRVLGSLVELIRNVDEVEKIIAEIDSARDAANKKIAVVGKISDIESLRGQAAASLEQATDTLTNAKREAEKILGQAGSTAAAENARQKRADEIFAAADARDAELDTRQSKLAAGERELQEQKDALRDLKTNFNSLYP